MDLPIVDEYLALVAAEYGREMAREVASHLHSFFASVAKEPEDVSTADVLGFQRQHHPDGERRLGSVIGLFIYIESGVITAPHDRAVSRSDRR